MEFDTVSLNYNDLPEFYSHEEARRWFKEQYHERFSLRGSNLIDGKTVYFYHLIKNPEHYQSYMESFAKPVEHDITNASTFESYSTIEISEDGAVNFLP